VIVARNGWEGADVRGAGILWKFAELSVVFRWRRFREGLIINVIQRVSRKTLFNFRSVLSVGYVLITLPFTGLYISLCNDILVWLKSDSSYTSLSLRERPPFPVFHFHFLAKTVALLSARELSWLLKGRMAFGKPS